MNDTNEQGKEKEVAPLQKEATPVLESHKGGNSVSWSGQVNCDNYRKKSGVSAQQVVQSRLDGVE
jgi:hypothetical protein